MRMLNVSFDDNSASPEAPNEDSSYPAVTLDYLIFASLSMIISNLILFVIISYLKNISLVRQCLVICIYEDLAMIMICLNSVWEIRLLLSYSIGDGLGIVKTISLILSFCAFCLMGILLSLMNVVSALKLYMNKTNLLDPPMPWGDDEKIGMITIRIIYAIPIIGITATMYGLGIYPKLYYLFAGLDSNDFFQQPQASLVYPVTLLFLISTSLLTFLGAKFYKSQTLHLNEVAIPRQINYFLWMNMIFISLTIFISAFNLLSERNHWKLFRLNIIILQVATPAIVILRNDQIKTYSYNLIKDTLDQIFFMQIYWTPAVLSFVMFFVLHLIYGQFGI